MPRKRMIDPRIWESAYKKNLSTDDFTVLVSAISNADDEGRGEISMVERAAGKMLTQKEFKKSLTNLSDTIKIYLDIYYYLPNWTEYQSLNRPKPSKLPLPPTNGSVHLASDQTKSLDGTVSHHEEDTVSSVSSHGLITDESVTSHANDFAIRKRIRKRITAVAVEEEGKDDNSDDVTRSFAVWERPPRDRGEIQACENLLKQFGFEKVKRAFHIASEKSSEKNDKRNVAYVRGILNNTGKNQDKFAKGIGEG